MVKEEIIQLLRSTDIPHINKLIIHMIVHGFFKSPCSGSNHLCEEGGLAQHSLNVYHIMKKLVESLDAGDEISDTDIIICSILHDLGKMGDFGKANYTPNFVRSKTKNKETGEYDLIQSTSKPYTTNKELLYVEHEIRSIVIAERYIQLTEEQEHAILNHNGMYGKLNNSFNTGYDKTKLSFLLHTADMYASRFEEVD